MFADVTTLRLFQYFILFSLFIYFVHFCAYSFLFFIFNRMSDIKRYAEKIESLYFYFPENKNVELLQSAKGSTSSKLLLKVYI